MTSLRLAFVVALALLRDMKLLWVTLLAVLALGAGMVPATALAAPSAACDDANTGKLDISGTLPATKSYNGTATIGEIFTATLSGAVSNSLLSINGTTLFSGNTSGKQSYTILVAAIAILYDIQGGGKMTIRCKPVGGTGPTPPTGGTPSAEDMTKLMVMMNSPLSAVYIQLWLAHPTTPLGSILGDLLSAPVCPVARQDRIDDLEDDLDDLEEDIGLQERLLELAGEDVEEIRGQLATTVLTGSTTVALVASAAERAALGRAYLIYAELERLKAIYNVKLRELEVLYRCGAILEGSTPQQAYFDNTSAFADNSLLSAFAPFEMGGTTTLFEEEGIRVFATGGAHLFAGSDSTAGAKGALSIGAARRIDQDTAIGAQIGIAGGHTSIGASSTIGDFFALSGLIASSHMLAESVQLDLGLAGGLAWNHVDIAGATGTFGSAEIAASAALSGKRDWNGFILAPSAVLSVSHLATAAYTLSDATPVAATATTTIDASAGLRISRPMAMFERDLVFEPFVEPRIGYRLDLPGSSLDGLWASVGIGLEGTHADGLGFQAGSTFTLRPSGFAIGFTAGAGGTL